MTPTPDRLTAGERFAAEAILDRRSSDPDDDAAIVARAALRLATRPEPGGLDAATLAKAMVRVNNPSILPGRRHGLLAPGHEDDAAHNIVAEYARLREAR